VGETLGKPITISFGELTGAIGDSVTVLPIVVAVATLTDLPLAPLLLGFGAFQVVWGLYYGVPVSVEPMKALAALLIAGALSVPEFLLAGLLSSLVLLVVGTAGLLARVQAVVGDPVIRGIQVAVALVLVETGIELGLGDPGLALAGVAVALGVAAVGYRRASALVVLAVGVRLAAFATGAPSVGLPSLTPAVPVPTAADPLAVLEATGAQLAMTVGNAAVATAVLLDEFYDADVSPDELATSMGAMNLLAIPLGGMAMCHGSGGVAGKHAFGARTAGANLLLGALYGLAALVAVELVMAFPMAILGVVVVLVALELGRAGLESDHLPLTLGIGVLGLLTNVGIAFLVGIVGWAVLEYRRDDERSDPQSGTGGSDGAVPDAD